MYIWRKLSPTQREEVMRHRKQRGFPHHSPPHFSTDAPSHYHLTGACYEHRPIIGFAANRLTAFAELLAQTFNGRGASLHAWCVLPNHWHALVLSLDVRTTAKAIGRLHGRTSRQWNLEDEKPGRTCWHSCSDRRIRSNAHFWATVNYIHHNPVHHGYVTHWKDWPYSSANVWLKTIGENEARRIWRTYPILDYGNGWDDPEN
jgi:putative transposase